MSCIRLGNSHESDRAEGSTLHKKATRVAQA
jgi:hypothetical protein